MKISGEEGRAGGGSSDQERSLSVGNCLHVIKSGTTPKYFSGVARNNVVARQPLLSWVSCWTEPHHDRDRKRARAGGEVPVRRGRRGKGAARGRGKLGVLARSNPLCNFRRRARKTCRWSQDGCGWTPSRPRWRVPGCLGAVRTPPEPPGATFLRGSYRDRSPEKMICSWIPGRMRYEVVVSCSQVEHNPLSPCVTLLLPGRAQPSCSQVDHNPPAPR